MGQLGEGSPPPWKNGRTSAIGNWRVSNMDRPGPLGPEHLSVAGPKGAGAKDNGPLLRQAGISTPPRIEPVERGGSRRFFNRCGSRPCDPKPLRLVRRVIDGPAEFKKKTAVERAN